MSMAVNINGYLLTTEWSTSGNCQWAYAQKNGREWFIKEFMCPKYKLAEDGFSQKAVENARSRCEIFRESQNLLYSRIRSASTGNVVAPEDFFSYGTKFYSVSPRVNIVSTCIEDVTKMDHEGKLNLLKVLTYNLKRLHENGVVHADLKPDNILLKKTGLGYTFKLIDFDASFLESDPKRGRDISFDIGFMAPETAVARSDKTVSLTKKVDVFALGLLFHLYYTGNMPRIPEEFDNTSSAVHEGILPQLEEGLPCWLAALIRSMLQVNPDARPDCETIFNALRLQTFPPQAPVAEPEVKTLAKKKGWQTLYKSAGK